MTPAFLHPFARPAREQFVRIVRGSGALLWDADGREYVDGMAALWYCAIGHGRDEMAEAIATQVRRLAAYSCFDPFTNEPADTLTEQLRNLSPIADTRVFLCGSGSESIDTAMKLARLAHGLGGDAQRTMIVSRGRGYHGTNFGGTSAQGIPPNREGWGPLVPDVVQVPADDAEALAVLFTEHGERIAALIVEPVQGAGGVWPPQEGYLAACRRLCDQHGALLIFDEVISGFGRLGTWFAAGYYGVTPDMITFAKAVTSGYQPLGGVLVGPRVHQPLAADPDYVLKTGYTYSGHATCCAAALANLAILDGEQLLARATPLGERLRQGLASLADDGQIAGVRGVGGVTAAAMQPGVNAAVVRDRMLEAGVIVRAVADHTIAMCPPLVISDDQIDRIVDALAAALTRR